MTKQEKEARNLITKCRGLLAKGAIREWTIGHMLVKLRVGKYPLWTYVIDRNTKAPYFAWRLFVSHELGMTSEQAAISQRIAKSFSRAQLVRSGSSVSIDLLRRLSNLKREELREKILRMNFGDQRSSLDKLPDSEFIHHRRSNPFANSTLQALGKLAIHYGARSELHWDKEADCFQVTIHINKVAFVGRGYSTKTACSEAARAFVQAQKHQQKAA